MGKKLDCLLDAAKNAPRALLEIALVGSVVSGTAELIASGASYLLGHKELASKLLGIGVVSAGLGLVASGIYAMLASKQTDWGVYEPDIAIYNFLDAIKEYKKVSKEKIKWN